MYEQFNTLLCEMTEEEYDLVQDRFWNKVDKKETGCWEWEGGRLPEGYGLVCIFNDTYLTHRVSYEFEYGDIPKNKIILHSCDNKPCVNPKHLHAGTFSENMFEYHERKTKMSDDKSEVETQ